MCGLMDLSSCPSSTGQIPDFTQVIKRKWSDTDTRHRTDWSKQSEAFASRFDANHFLPKGKFFFVKCTKENYGLQMRGKCRQSMNKNKEKMKINLFFAYVKYLCMYIPHFAGFWTAPNISIIIWNQLPVQKSTSNFQKRFFCKKKSHIHFMN